MNRCHQSPKRSLVVRVPSRPPDTVELDRLCCRMGSRNWEFPLFMSILGAPLLRPNFPFTDDPKLIRTIRILEQNPPTCAFHLFPRGVGPRESSSNSYFSLPYLLLKSVFNGVRRELREFFLLIYRQQRNNKIPAKAKPPTTPPITEPTFVVEFEGMLVVVVAEDCAGLSPACVGVLNPIVDAIAWLGCTLWLGVDVMLE